MPTLPMCPLDCMALTLAMDFMCPCQHGCVLSNCGPYTLEAKSPQRRAHAAAEAQHRGHAVSPARHQMQQSQLYGHRPQPDSDRTEGQTAETAGTTGFQKS